MYPLVLFVLAPMGIIPFLSFIPLPFLQGSGFFSVIMYPSVANEALNPGLPQFYSNTNPKWPVIVASFKLLRRSADG